MTPFRSLLVASSLALATAGALAAQESSSVVQPVPQISPASAAPGTIPQPQVRVDSKPQAGHSPRADSAPLPKTYGMDVDPAMDLGNDATPEVAANMLGTIPVENPAMIFYSLPTRTAAQMNAPDAALLTAKQGELFEAARHRGYDLAASSWSFAQVVCPAAEPGASTHSDIAGSQQGAVLLQYKRPLDNGRTSVVSAVLLRVDQGNSGRVQAIGVPHDGKLKLRKQYNLNGGRSAVNDAIPPQSLYAHLQPREDWLATAACIMAVNGATPHIPDRPDLDVPITTAPSPTLRLLLNGQRTLILTDREDADHYSVWNEEITRKGKLVRVTRERRKVRLAPVTNPPEPKVREITSIPQPKIKGMPQPPSPLSGQQQ